MAHPVCVVASDMPLKAALDLMVQRAISSVFVADIPEPGQPVGAYRILTERDVMRRISLDGPAAFGAPVGESASGPIETIRENAFVYRAIGRMTRLRYRHLGVRDDNGMLTGIVSARDLLKVRAGAALVLDDGIETAENHEELAAAWATLPAVVNSLLSDEVDARIVCRIVSEEIRSMTRRAAVLAVRRMEDSGRGPPPCRYSVLVLGSGGRGESMLVPDQDNAVVFEAGEPGGPVDNWFAEMAGHMSEILDKAGHSLLQGRCHGEKSAMARIARRVAGTHQGLGGQVAPRGPAQRGHLLRRDSRSRATTPLARRSSTSAMPPATRMRAFAKLLGENVSSIGSALTMFGGFKTDGNRLDLKKHVLFPVSAMARALAIRHDVRQRATRDRLDGLGEIGSTQDLAALADVHRLALELVLAQQSADIEAGLRPGTLVEVDSLPRERKADLREGLKRIQVIPELMRNMMFAAKE